MSGSCKTKNPHKIARCPTCSHPTRFENPTCDPLNCITRLDAQKTPWINRPGPLRLGWRLDSSTSGGFARTSALRTQPPAAASDFWGQTQTEPPPSTATARLKLQLALPQLGLGTSGCCCGSRCSRGTLPNNWALTSSSRGTAGIRVGQIRIQGSDPNSKGGSSAMGDVARLY